MINEHINQLRSLMRERSIDAYLVPTADFHESEYVGEHFKCRQFITGFTGSAGTAVITQDHAGLWTDGRYFVQAEKQLANTTVKLHRMGGPGVPTVEEFLRETLEDGGTLGFDGRVINDAFGHQLMDSLRIKKISFAYEEDLIDLIWRGRPSMPANPLWILEERYCGKPTSEKLADLRRDMAKAGITVHILTALDEIAWLLNLRGNDIPCNPVFLSYAIVTEQDFHLFLHRETLTPPVTAYLEKNHVTIYPYGDIYQRIRELRGETVLLERKKVNYTLCESLDSSNYVVDRMNPCAFKKAVKNEAEIENMRNVHIKDGVAVTRFMYWLKQNVGKISMDELSAAAYLEEMRRAQQGYLEPSFVTISAYKDNAAMCHYRASDEQNRPLRPEGFLLVDSGGQYYEGTTDITRTMALGPLTPREKEYFTIVSMAMLKVGDMKFLHGCRGINLDYTIREAFWKRGLDFNHGTGHGVGYLSGVHERPNGIRWKMVPEREDSAVIEPGMICSDEPGMYFEGEFGVRTENMILCVPDEKNQYGQFLRFEFLTFAPIDLDGIDKAFLNQEDIRRLNSYHKEVYEKLSPFLPVEEQEWLKHATRAVEK